MDTKQKCNMSNIGKVSIRRKPALRIKLCKDNRTVCGIIKFFETLSNCICVCVYYINISK